MGIRRNTFGKTDELIGIDGCCGTPQYGIVARTFGFEDKPSSRLPHQWMKPVACAHDSREAVDQPVSASYVIEFMNQSPAQVLLNPGGRIQRQQDGVVQKTTGHRPGDRFVEEHLCASVKARLL